MENTRFLIFSLLVFIGFQVVNSQNDYLFNERLNTLITEKENHAPKIYSINEKKVMETITTSDRVISTTYELALNRLEKAKKKQFINNQIAVRYSAILELKESVKSFLKSKESFENKKQLLHKAQEISSKYRLEYLVYADTDFNAEMLPEFQKLQDNEPFLQNHLKEVVANINKTPYSKPAKNSVLDKEIIEAQTALKDIPKFEDLVKKATLKTYNVYTLENILDNPDHEIIGDYTSLGEYYVLNDNFKKLSKNQLISVLEAENASLNHKKLMFNMKTVLIKSNETNKKYLVFKPFIKHYALNIIAQEEKQKHTTLYSDKIYKIIDNFNKSDFASMHD